MCRRDRQPNYYIAIGMLLSTGTYFLYDAHWITHEIRFISLVISVILMMYGVYKIKSQSRN